MAQKLPLRGIQEHYDVKALNPGLKGVYTVVEYRRKDGTLYMRSTLSTPIGNFYTKNTWEYFDEIGTTIVHKVIWNFVYDAKGNIIDKVVTQ